MSDKSNLTLQELKNSLIEDLNERVQDKILEPSNRDLLSKLISNAESKTEAISIAELGTTYKRTGFHFDKKLEKTGSTIKYFEKNEKLSFVTDKDKLTHKLIIGDNYDALLNLSISHRGKIDVIYIDPPYGKDNMGEFAKTNYENAITRDNLLSMLYPRLVLAKELLSDEGVIFCSIDEKNSSYVRELFDEIFTENNFRSIITVNANPGGRDYGGIAKCTEYVLVYTNNTDVEISKIQTDKKLAYSDEYGAFEPRELRNRNTKFNNKNRPNLYYPFYINPNSKDKDGFFDISLEQDSSYSVECYPLISQGIQTVWRWGKEEKSRKNLNINLKAKLKNDGSYMIIEKYRDERVMIKNLLVDKKFRTEQGSLELKSIFNSKIFDYPKPVELILTLLKSSSKKESIILDFFAGSGTTGQAVLELNKEDGGNRTFILCTNNEKTDLNPNGIAIDVTSHRLKRVMTGECYDGNKDFKWIKDNTPLGDNLDVYDIAEVSNIEQAEGKSAFDVIDETLYGHEERLTPQEKIKFVCENFSITQKKLEE